MVYLFIHRTEHDTHSLNALKEGGSSVKNNRLVVRTTSGLWEFFDVDHDYTEPKGQQSITHYAAIGPGGALQIVARDQRTFRGQEGPRSADPMTGEIQPLRMRIDWEVSRVFSPGYWQDLRAVSYGKWLDEPTMTESHTGIPA